MKKEEPRIGYATLSAAKQQYYNFEGSLHGEDATSRQRKTSLTPIPAWLGEVSSSVEKFFNIINFDTVSIAEASKIPWNVMNKSRTRPLIQRGLGLRTAIQIHLTGMYHTKLEQDENPHDSSETRNSQKIVRLYLSLP